MPDYLQGAPIVGGLRRVERATVSIPVRQFDPPNAANRVYRPILSLQIVKGALRLPWFGIVDSGADFCAFPMSFAHTLGLNPLNQTPSATFGAGSGGPAQTYQTFKSLTIQVARIARTAQNRPSVTIVPPRLLTIRAGFESRPAHQVSPLESRARWLLLVAVTIVSWHSHRNGKASFLAFRPFHPTCTRTRPPSRQPPGAATAETSARSNRTHHEPPDASNRRFRPEQK